MPIVAIVGVDNVGKTTLINKLKEKYDIDTFAFPTPKLRKELESLKIDYTDIYSILNYHMRFQLDFSEQQALIKEYKNNNKLLILDRYIYCSLAYLRQAVLRHHLEDYWKRHIRPLLWGYYEQNMFYRDFISPDHIIWLLRKDVNDEEEKEIQDCYHEELYDWMEHCDMNHQVTYGSIEALKEDTFTRVEALLKDRGYI